MNTGRSPASGFELHVDKRWVKEVPGKNFTFSFLLLSPENGGSSSCCLFVLLFPRPAFILSFSTMSSFFK